MQPRRIHGSAGWKEIEFLRVRVQNPNTGKSVEVDAAIYNYPFFGTIAELGIDVVRELGLLLGEPKIGYDDDSGPEITGGEIEWHEGEAIVSFRDVSVRGNVSLSKRSRDTYLHSHFLIDLERSHNPKNLMNKSWGSRLTKIYNQKKVFLSHSHADKKFCRYLARKLDSAGIKVWVDNAEIRIGDSLIEKLRSAIDEVDYVIAVLSSNSVESEWVKRELDIAMNQEIESRRLKVMPVLRDDVDFPWFLKGKLYADFRRGRARHSATLALIESISGD